MSRISDRKDIVVVGTVYPGLGQFLEDYLGSLEAQSFQNFDLLVANDGVNGLDSLLAGRSLSWRSIEVDGSASSNRRALICNAMEMGYDKIIFADCDDTFEENRIEIVSTMLNSDCIVINDLDVVDAGGAEKESRYFSHRFSEHEVIEVDSLRAGNMMGLTNSAVRSEVFQKCPALVSGDSEAFDWYLWSSVLLEGYKARFTSKTSTRYRVYHGNTAGLPQQLDDESLAKGVAVKGRHYELMSKLDEKYSGLADEFRWLNEQIKDRSWCLRYLDALRERGTKYHLWWENIQAPSEVGLR